MKVAICVPAHDHVSAFFAYDLAQLVGWSTTNIADLTLTPIFTLGTLLQASRERLVEAALKRGADYVLFIDADMRFPKTALKRLLEAGKPIVGINYCQRSEPFWPVARYKITEALEDRVLLAPTVEGLVRVAATGFGLMLIQADYLQKMEKPRFAVPWSRAGSEYVTEDMYFATRAEEVGAEMFIDNTLSYECRHTGSFEFTLEHATQYIFNKAQEAKEAETQ